MTYKVNVGSPSLAAFSASFGGILAGTVSAPNPIKEVLAGLMLLSFVALGWKMAVLARKNRFLTFGEDELLFPSRTIRPEDIKHIITYERNRCFIIYLKGKWKAPISVAFNKQDEADIRSELRGWTWRNGVETKMNTFSWRRKAK